MILYAFPLGAAFLLLCYLFRETCDRLTRWIGGGMILLGTVCFILYLSGITGIGLSEQIVKWFEKAGMDV